MPSLTFLQPMRPYPTPEVHSIQVTRTVAALGEYIDVLLVVDSVVGDPAAVRDAVREHYGVEFGPRVRVVMVPRRRLKSHTFHRGLREILGHMAPDSVFYTRSTRMAHLLLRYRWWHRRSVFFETHKKAGYWNKEPLPNSRYADIRKRFAKRNEPLQVIKGIYRRADCVFFLHRHSMALAEREQPLRQAEHLWYGMLCDPPANGAGHARQGIAYVGSLTEDKLIDVLLDALDRVESDVRVAIFGGTDNQARELELRAAGRPCSRRIEWRGSRSPRQLRQALAEFRFGVAMQEGMKAVDYVECGLTPIVPFTPAYRDEFDTRHVLYYAPDDPEELAAALDRSGSYVPDSGALREFCESHTTDLRARKIVNCIT